MENIHSDKETSGNVLETTRDESCTDSSITAPSCGFNDLPHEALHENRKELRTLDFQSADDVSYAKPSHDAYKADPFPRLSSLQIMTTFVIKKCDDCRQTMKAVLSGKQSVDVGHGDEGTDGMDKGTESKDTEVNDDRGEDQSDNLNKSKNTQVFNTYTFDKQSLRSNRNNATSPPPLKKRGRPPKAGPSKKTKRVHNTVNDLYHGKLSNLMRFSDDDASDYASDVSSVSDEDN